MADTEKSIFEWQQSTFGKTTPDAAFERMMMEVEELEGEIKHGGLDVEWLGNELADVYITMVRLAGELGISIQDEVDKKMAINRKRKWKVGEDGNAQHIKE